MIFLLCIIVLLLFILWKWSVMLKQSKIVNVPGPTPLPVLGNGHLLIVPATEFLNVLYGLFDKYGNTIRLHLLSEVYMVTREAAVIEGIVTSNDLGIKGTSYIFLKPFLGEGLLTSNGSRWKQHRKLLTPAFHFNILHNFLPIFIRNEKNMIEKMLSHKSGKPLDLFPIVTLAALDNVIESVMGVSIDAQKNSDSTYVKNIEIVSRIVAERIRNIFLATEFIFKVSPKSRELMKAIEYLHNYTMMVIETRRKELKTENVTHLVEQADFGTKNRYAFLDILLLAEVNGKRIPDEWIREEVDTFLFEGHDTTSSGIVYTLYCIAQHPEVQEKLYEEQQKILNGDLTRDVTYSDLNEMKYLGLVIKESLRLYPPVPLIERYVTENTNIAGYNILKNTSVILNIFHLQRNPEYFEEPLKFKPERFTNDKVNNTFSWLAFSAGTRNCIGQKFAILEMKVAISAVVRKFKLFPVDESLDFTPNLILKTPNGVNVIVEPRK